MIYFWMLGVAAVLMLPLAFAFRRGRVPTQRRDAAVALHKAQLLELSRDLAERRIGPVEYEAAKLEVERRLLAADALSEPVPEGSARLLLAGVVVAVPMLAFALYLPGSTPDVPSEPHAQWLARQQRAQAEVAQVIERLRAHLAGLPQNSVDASQGEAYLAEALAEQAGQVTGEALTLFQTSLANAPAGASWRALDEQRVAEATGAGN